MNHGAMCYSIDGNPDRSEREMKASLILGLTATLLAAVPITTVAADNAREQSEDSINQSAFLKSMNNEMKDWRQRVETYLAAAKAKSEQASPDLRWVWDQAKAASERVALVTETDWDSAKSAVERELAALKADRQ
jgi:hypothetical protein